ncbi:GNAT family N-acetyltransferase [Microbacterium sp. 69-10]|uniref:GNAT family N-acetyltransferase n=1 Tax=Microbacterium sp. 69-10 TaxID=1895783 RepID=UPI0025EE5CDB|nr:GNAT family N-acetyltransferase [Microbacterium sp. 69-10]
MGEFIGVDPGRRGQGVGRALYRAFFDVAAEKGRQNVHSVTSPENTGSQAFHKSLGFSSSEVLPDYDGPGLARVAFSTTTAAPARGARRLRVLDGALVLERYADADVPVGDWVALVRAPDGLTAVRPAPDSGSKDRWIALCGPPDSRSRGNRFIDRQQVIRAEASPGALPRRG